MTDWKQLQAEILDYLDGLLPAQGRRRVEQVLAENSEAQTFCDEMKLVRQQLRSLPVVKPSPDFNTVLRARIRMERSLERRSYFSWPGAIPVTVGAAALVLIAVFMIAPMLRTQNQPQLATREASKPSLAERRSTLQTHPAASRPVNYPMEQVSLSGGIPVNSTSLRARSVRPDSAGAFSREPQPVSIEF